MKYIKLFEAFIKEALNQLKLSPNWSIGIKKATGKNIVDYEEQRDSFRYKLVGSSKWHSISRKDLEKAIGWNESVNEAKVFDADVAKMIKQIKSGMGWIDPEFVEETWENISDTIDFGLVQKELYKRLIDAKWHGLILIMKRKQVFQLEDYKMWLKSP